MFDRTLVPQILVAEDDAALLALIAESLRDNGCAVIECRTGHELLEVVTAAPNCASVLIADVRMPGVTGLEVLEGLGELGWTAPVILMTAFGDPALHEAARRLGAAATFDKPFDIDDLLTAVEVLMSERLTRPTTRPSASSRSGCRDPWR